MSFGIRGLEIFLQFVIGFSGRYHSSFRTTPAVPCCTALDGA
jgi:hypothetical protein